MTDKRKDEIWVVPYEGEGNSDFMADRDRYIYSEPEKAIKYVRADLSPPVPDDVAEAIKACKSEPQHNNGGYYEHRYINTLIRYAQEKKQ